MSVFGPTIRPITWAVNNQDPNFVDDNPTPHGHGSKSGIVRPSARCQSGSIITTSTISIAHYDVVVGHIEMEHEPTRPL
jgi:hypothetical protein